MPKSKKFRKLLRATREFYTGKPVPRKYQKKYGKRYSRKEAESIAHAISRKQGWWD